jgi:hypothetical protein
VKEMLGKAHDMLLAVRNATHARSMSYKLPEQEDTLCVYS